MATPIIKAWKKSDTKKKNMLKFYTLTEFEAWKKKKGKSIKNYKTKYYKGLGSSTNKEAKDDFNDFENKLIKYVWNHNDYIDGDDEINNGADNQDSEDAYDKTSESYDAMTLAFSKKRSNDRKKWLKNYDKNNIIENDVKIVSYADYVHKELIHFSNYDLIRSIPSICDGLKPSQRKILYGAFLRKILKDEIKVSQLAGFVSDKAAYHHGEASLQGAIVGMAQNYVGSNNINLLTPNGEFGNRTKGGKNAASPRYIFTQLNELTVLIFRKEDEYIYSYVDDDGQKVEPTTYLSIIPMILINGAQGIGTGFSTFLPCFNPQDIINNTKRMINGNNLKYMYPWYSKFTGKIIKLNNSTFFIIFFNNLTLFWIF